jgi:hypothetical protein
MEWKITIHKKEKYIEIITEGIVDKDASLEMAKAITKTMRGHRVTKALIDHRNISVVTGKLIDVYKRPGFFKIIGVLLKIKIAVIINPDHMGHFKFLETVCINQGYTYLVFHEKAAALEWLQV